MWLLVAVPDPQVLPAATPTSLVPPSHTSDESSALNNPDLRMPSDRFQQLREEGRIIIVDVRTETEYRSAHIPGAISIPFEGMDEQGESLRKSGKLVVTYCS